MAPQDWVFDASGNSADTTDNFGSITVAGDGKTFSAKGTTIQYDVNGDQVYQAADLVFAGTRFAARAAAATPRTLVAADRV
jgi:hypothetical protein